MRDDRGICVSSGRIGFCTGNGKNKGCGRKEEDYTAVFDMSTNTFEIHKDVPGPIALQHASVWENAVISLSVMFLAVIGAALYVSAKIIVQKPTEILRNR